MPLQNQILSIAAGQYDQGWKRLPLRKPFLPFPKILIGKAVNLLSLANRFCGPDRTGRSLREFVPIAVIDIAQPVQVIRVKGRVLPRDIRRIAKKFNANTAEFYAELAKAWMDDKDAVPDKTAVYLDCIVK